MQEEVASYGEDTGGETDDVLAVLHNDALNTLAMEHIVSKIDIPMWEDLGTVLEATKKRVNELKKFKQQLLAQLND